MTGQEKIEAALSLEGTDQIPVVICYEGIYIRDHWAELSDCPWWFPHSADLEHQKAWMSEVTPRIGQDWMYLESCYSREYRKHNRIVVQDDSVFLETIDPTIGKPGERKPLAKPEIGGWENMIARSGGDRSTEWRVEPFANTPELIDYALPQLPEFEMEGFIQAGQRDLADWQLEAFGDRFPIRHISIPLTDCYYLWGFEGMMEMVAERPDLVAYACERYLSRAIRQARIAKALGAKGIWLEDCFTDMISPDAFESLNLRYARQLVEEIHSLGMSSIYYFCGDPKGKLDLILASGAQALSLEESKKGFVIDIEEIVEKVAGRCAVLGNLDAIQLLPKTSEAELRAEICRQIRAGRRNKDRFIMGIGSPVTPGTSVERVELFCEICREEGERRG